MSLVEMLVWYAETELDQHFAWRIETADGPIYVTMTRKPLPGTYDSMYAPVAPT